MIIFHIEFEVKPEHVETFIQATTKNAKHTVQEAGNLRFDLFKEDDSDNTFILMEIYKDKAAQEAHGKSDHFTAWREATNGIFENTVFKSYETVFPTETDWSKS